MTAQVMLNLTSVNITWVNGSTSAPSIPLVFNATYNFPGIYQKIFFLLIFKQKFLKNIFNY